MKKQLMMISLISCAWLISTHSHGQFKAGFKAGYTLSALAGLSDQAGVKEAKTLSGYHAGLFGQFNLALITLQVDAVYNTQGGKYIDTNDNEHKYENNYLNIPAVAKVNLGPIFVLGGLQYGLVMSSKIDGVKDEDGFFFKKTDMAIPLGIGLNVKKVIVEARYIIGISNVNNISSAPEMANTVIQLSAGLKFGKE
jgi:hypothetical protein